MMRISSVWVWVALVLDFLPGFSSEGCSFREGACTYNIQLTHRNGGESDPGQNNCGSKDQQIFIDPVQNDYVAKINDIEKNFSFLRDAHEQRIRELESTVIELRDRGYDTSPLSQSRANIISDTFRRQSRVGFNNDPLMRKLEEEFNKLHDDIRRKTEELAETSLKLNETTNYVHEIQLQHFQTSQDLLNAENEIIMLKRERAVLKNQLKDRSYRLDVATEKASECEVKTSELQEKMTELFRSENTLQEELMTVQLKLNKSKEVYSLMEERHVSLKDRHEKMRAVMKMREQELIECFKAKTNTFCGFEDSKLCGFTNVNDSSDFFDWDRGKGLTPSAGTGPTKDHTCDSPNGHYMFIEASAKARGNNAILFSPLYRGLSEQCVEFFYHMNGKHVGTLNVYAQAQGDVLKSAWRAFGNQGDVWTNARLAIPQELAMAGYQIAFEGITENGYLGDISIDDISVTDGPCPVDGNLAPVLIDVNSTLIAKKAKTFVRKLRKGFRNKTP